MNPGLLGAIVGSTVGIMGGVIGTYFSIKNTQGKKERAYIIKASILCWVAIGVFLALLLTLPTPYNFLLWIPYGIFLPLFIHTVNKQLSKLRNEEQQS